VPLAIRALSDRIYDVLRERIVAGELGERAVRQDALAQELGVSKIPVREALSRLAQDGLLTRIPNRGWFVCPLSMAEADEIYALRLAIEPLAAAHACAVATPAEREAVRHAYAALEDATRSGLSALARHNREFHLALVTAATQPLTRRLIEQLALLAERYVAQHLRPHGRSDRARGEHAALLAAWIAGDRTQVATLLATHIGATLDDLRQQLSGA
jgi:DNA-binding GntR family transcriptional regulator